MFAPFCNAYPCYDREFVCRSRRKDNSLHPFYELRFWECVHADGCLEEYSFCTTKNGFINSSKRTFPHIYTPFHEKK